MYNILVSFIFKLTTATFRVSADHATTTQCITRVVQLDMHREAAAAAAAAPTPAEEAGKCFVVNRQTIEEELTSKTPCCGRAFQLVQGCLAVQCPQCKAIFCGGALQCCNKLTHAYQVKKEKAGLKVCLSNATAARYIERYA